MIALFGIPLELMFGQLLLGLINGCFYALLSLGLAVIFGMLRVVNFAHGAQYTLGAFVAYLLLTALGVNFWFALVLAPLVVALIGMPLERFLLSRLYGLDHLYGLLLTFGFALIVEGILRHVFGVAGRAYPVPASLAGGIDLDFLYMPIYRAYAIGASLVVCFGTWYAIERTKMGSYLRAATENPALVQAFGINVPLLMTLTYGAGVALAGLAGVLAAPVYQVSPRMGADLIVIVFAVVVIGGLGSIMGAIVTGIGLGLAEAFCKVFWPEASATVVFVMMALVLLLQRPSEEPAGGTFAQAPPKRDGTKIAALVLLAIGLAAPLFGYPIFLMKALCYALYACAFNLLIGYAGLLSFGHAAYYGSGAYAAGYAAKTLGATTEVALIFGTLVATALGALFGSLSIRRSGIYFAMTTLAFAQLVYFFCLQAPFTGGEDGMQSIPRGRLFGVLDLTDHVTMYYLVLAIVLGGLFAIHRIVHSPFGQVLKAIRENETRARSLGYDVARYKVMVFTLSAALAGLAGATKALVFQIATLTDVFWANSGEVVLMALLGGIGTQFGPVVGAIFLAGLDNYLAAAGAWITIIMGGIYVLCVMTFRRGLVGEWAHRFRIKL
ncbi:MAG: ABC transporter permease [Proteobacteria bacterium]|nr:ABC transporter permease [Pseudomonadota bacterium]